MNQFLFVGERRSPRAVKMGVHWQDEALAAKPLFAALRAAGIDPTLCRFTNWFEAGAPLVREHTGTIVALGHKVQQALTAEQIEHIALVHPAARGSIRLRANYIAHVIDALGDGRHQKPLGSSLTALPPPDEPEMPHQRSRRQRRHVQRIAGS